MAGCVAGGVGMKHQDDLSVWSLQELHRELH
jgi:carbamoyl-phosphate synthase large subunit